MKRIAASAPQDAIDMICNYWYRDYAREKELDIGKCDILYSLAVQEKTITGFLERLELLPKLIENYHCSAENPVILSTIHSAKGLEFDIVYVVDAYDGSLPHSGRETAKEQERIDNYEEERRLFYVAITRAKNELYLLSVNECKTGFINEIVPESHTNQYNKVDVEFKDKHTLLSDILTPINVSGMINNVTETTSIPAQPYKRSIREYISETNDQPNPVSEEKTTMSKQQKYEIGLSDVSDKFTQQTSIIRDRFGARWVKCVKCGAIKQDYEFSSYGGENTVNLGTCGECSRKRS